MRPADTLSGTELYQLQRLLARESSEDKVVAGPGKALMDAFGRLQLKWTKPHVVEYDEGKDWDLTCAAPGLLKKMLLSQWAARRRHEAGEALTARLSGMRAAGRCE